MVALTGAGMNTCVCRWYLGFRPVIPARVRCGRLQTAGQVQAAVVVSQRGLGVGLLRFPAAFHEQCPDPLGSWNPQESAMRVGSRRSPWPASLGSVVDGEDRAQMGFVAEVRSRELGRTGRSGGSIESHLRAMLFGSGLQGRFVQGEWSLVFSPVVKMLSCRPVGGSASGGRFG